MIKIPNTDKRWKLANSTDLFGNVYSTKNINFDSEGLLKLSDASVALKSEKDDANFDTAIGFGQYGTGSGILSTIDKAYIIDIGGTDYYISQDVSANTPTGGTRSHAKWWQDAWYQTQSTSLVRAVYPFPTWSTSLISLTSSLNHPLEVFKNRNTMVIGNGNAVIQINTSHSTASEAQLALPSGLEVTSIAYGSNSIAIGTKNNQTNNGSTNTSAYFFIWDGTTSAANVGISVDSTYIIAVSSYQESSFVCLTGAGQLLKFNGSGFDILANLPLYYEDIDWVDYYPNFKSRNGIIKTDGDIIYINIPNDVQKYGENGTRLKSNFPGGIYCYDPKVGLYHKYSPSTSLAIHTSCSSIDLDTNIITVGGTSVPATGTPVRYNTASTPFGGLKKNKLYYGIYVSSSSFKLANTYTEALAGTAIDITSGTASFQYFNFYNIKDMGQFYNKVPGLVDILGSSENRKFGNIIWSAELNSPTLSPSDSAYVGFTMPDIETRGYFVTPRIESTNVKDIFKKIYIKYQPLVQDIDKIVVKYRTTKRDDFPLIVPQEILSGNGNGVWVDTDTFTTTADLTDTVIGDEVEILAGSGAGQTAHILTRTYDAGTWTVNLDEPIKYVVASDKCQFAIDNWNKIKTIDNTNTEGIEEIPLAINSKWIQFKVELRGVGVTIEELQIINETFLESN